MADPRQITELPVATSADDEDIALIRQGTYDKQATLDKLRAPLLRASNNLSDLDDAAEARENLGLTNMDKVLVDSGSADAYAVSGSGLSSYSDTDNLLVRISNANTGACTLEAESLGAKAVVMPDESDLESGALVEEGIYLFVYDADGDGGSGAWVVQTVPAAGIPFDNTTASLPNDPVNVQGAIESLRGCLGGGVKVFTSSGTFEPGQDSVPSWVTQVWVEAVGGGGGGGYVQASGFNGNSAGGGGGAFAAGWTSVETGTSVTITIGAGGTAGTSGTVNGTAGGTSSFGTAVSAVGGSGGESINTAYGSQLQIAGGAKASCVGDITEDGGPGCPSGALYSTYPYGGCSRFGHAGITCHSAGQDDSNAGAVGPGAGGRGSIASNGYSGAGTDGLDGEVRVFWYGATA